MSIKARIPVALAAFALVVWSAGGAAGQDKEHPEHPEKASKASKEHPEHPEHPESEVKVTKDSLADAIEAYVKWDSELHGGYLFVQDAKEGETLALTLDKVHRERLSSLGHGVHFACADFKATNGHVYDIDMFMKTAPASPFGGLMVTEIAVHKKDGKARYSWYEKDGVWKKKK